MKTAVICFSRQGLALAYTLKDGLEKYGHETEISVKSRYIQEKEVLFVEEPLKDWARRQFSEKDALLFIGACGIAVRAIAPCVSSKDTDPAVAAIDEKGTFAVPLLSGHLGGANRLAEQAASVTGAVPVITTATDVHQLFAVDLFAKENDLYITDLGMAKEISASLLAGIPVGFYSEFPVSGELPGGLAVGTDTELGICISVRKNCRPFPRTLRLVPKAVVLGIGCRKETKADIIRQSVMEILKKEQIELCAVGEAASIDLKREEQGILAFCREQNLSFTTFSAGELMQAGGRFSASDFVSRVTGADNVCERSAVLAAGDGGRLIAGKQAEHGVTTALALKDWRIRFES
ncbi:cobalt-precorrin 5A hydrolase [Anaerostipes sp.]|uniref:cobalt-precorrin 5A hydrolase n=1 Tax=Anaerostipes sp. TaxID=1872530 RepID=UPI0025C62C01|nr:cobalt-precorrin 5A hydrolase [Anaerostipes sp.]MBS7007396.1 cobalt-precorrin 5A hydrolase [Anaerostipes sp.]